MPEAHMTITEFLLARIEADEVAAQHALVGPHKTATPWVGVFRVVEDFDGGVAAEAASRWLAQHVARHDPARVLAECAAKRAILDLHRGVKFQPPSGNETWPYVHTFHSDGYVRIMKDGKEVERLWSIPEYLERFGIKAIIASELRALAAVYKDHPDYDEGWEL